MVLNRNGSRRRRLGFDIETGGSEITTSYTHDSSSHLITSSFRWTNAGGFPDKTLLVIQIGNELFFFDLDFSPISDGFLLKHQFPVGSKYSTYSYASVDGILVVASGIKEVKTFEFDGSSTITQKDVNLKVRDFWGVADIDSDGDNLKLDSNIQKRPTQLTSEHTYNLRNQTFALPRFYNNVETLADPISIFYNFSVSTTPKPPAPTYPSNADNVVAVLYADPNDADNRTVDRFWPQDLMTNPLGNYPAPIGYFIIDALERGSSRMEEELKLRQRNPALDRAVASLPLDKTPGGAKALAEFAGRVFYSGFSGSVIDGDDLSPHMSSYVLFSQVVRDITSIGNCYQEGDPTSVEAPELVDTDGGFIRIDGAYDIHALINSNDSLLVFARNGVWRISGGTESSFTANNYIVDKITSHGSQGQGSVVKIDNGISYWGDDGIYVVQRDQYGLWSAQNISQDTIQTLYNEIPLSAKQLARGIYDPFDLKVRWLYSNDINDTEETRELIFDLSMGAFYKHIIKKFHANPLPRVVDIFATEPSTLVLNQFNVVVGGNNVVAGSDNVVATIGTAQSIIRETSYLVITQISPVVKFAFGSYHDTTWRDWKSLDGSGIDADAYMVTGYISGGDFQRSKNLNYLTVYCKRSETNFVVDGDDYRAVPESSCLVQVQFEWTNSATSGRWGREFQAYRHRRRYMPPTQDSVYDDGYPVVATKNKVRGRGRVMSLQFKTEPDKDFNLLGWSMIIGVSGNV